MGVGVRCFQCKEKVQGKGTGLQHAKSTGHTWQPGYYCTDCKETFSNQNQCKKHIKKAGLHSKRVPTKSSTVSTPGPSSWSAMDQRGIAVPKEVSLSRALEIGTENGSSLRYRCTICGLTYPSKESLEEHFTRTSTCTKCGIHFYAFQKLKDHHCVVAPKPVASSSGASEIGTDTENVFSSEPPICMLNFASNESLEEHSTRTFTCTKCNIHFHASEKLQSHYRASNAHPNCRECGDGFPGVAEWATHRARCPPPVPPAAESNISSPRSISDGFSIASASARDSIPLWRFRSDRISVKEDADKIPVTGNLNRDCNADVPQDDLSLPKVDKGKGKAFSSNEVPTPTTTTATLERGVQRTAANPLSFHCRSCLANPCVEPVATLCGHIFCHSCIVREVTTKMCCPVCQRQFLVRLHVGVGS